jgi:hypothetical protein
VSERASRPVDVRVHQPAGAEEEPVWRTKNPDLPAGAFTASSTVARTTLQHEWVDTPFAGQRLRTWIEYPIERIGRRSSS